MMPLRILVTGASGLVGSALVSQLNNAGHTVFRAVRPESSRSAAGSKIAWDPVNKKVDDAALEKLDVVVHLAGENIAARRWSNKRKAEISASRLESTHFLVQSLVNLKHPPRLLISASAIGFYGNRGDEILTEESSAGAGFLADLCKAWETATSPATKIGIRVANLRIGIVLSQKGGALKKMLLPFKLGIGGKLGAGTQYMSWISIDDLIAAMFYIIKIESLSGPINAVSPSPVTNSEFTKTLGKVLRRPTIFSVPEFALRILFGALADEGLLASTRVMPDKLMRAGFRFALPELEECLMAGARSS